MALRIGTNRDDEISGTDRGDIIIARAGDDIINAGGGNDLIEAGLGNDTIDGGAGNDLIFAGAGDDVVVHVAAENGGGIDIYDGGSGADTLRLKLTQEEWAREDVKADVQAYLALLSSAGRPANTYFFESLALLVSRFETLEVFVDGQKQTVAVADPDAPPVTVDLGQSTNDEHVEILGDGDTEVTTGSADDVVVVGNGTNVIDVGEGQNQVTSGSGDDTVTAGEGGNTIAAGDGNNQVTTGAGADTIGVGSGDDVISSGGGDDHITIGDGDDIVVAGDGDDTIVAGQGGGDDVIDGSTGIDIVVYPSSTQNLFIDLREMDRFFVPASGGGTVGALLVNAGYPHNLPVGLAVGDDIGTDVLIGIENAVGGAGNDTFIGNDADNFFNGHVGSDQAIYDGSVLGYAIVNAPLSPLKTVTDTDPQNGNRGQDSLFFVEEAVFSDVTVFLDGRNNEPFTVLDPLSTTKDTSIAIDPADLLANDREFDGDVMSVTALVTSGTLGAATIDNNGNIIYDPNGQFALLAPGEKATDTFFYVVEDGNGGSATGTARVTLTSTSISLAALDGSDGFRLNGIDAGDSSGLSVSGAGDINGDGIDDLIIGAPGADDFSGESYVVFGGRQAFGPSFDLASLNGTNGFRLAGIAAGDFSGVWVSGAGDINGNGLADLIIGASGADSAAGESYVVFGADSFGPSLDLASLDGANGFRLNGIDAGDSSGLSVSGAGDINGDGIDDLIIGALNADPGGRINAGESYVVFGGQNSGASLDLASLVGTNGFRLNGIAPGDVSGARVSGAGDVNGDGIDDLIIGALGASPGGEAFAGESYVVFGGQSSGASLDLAGLDGTNGFRLNGIAAGDNSGISVSGAGDVNGDGLADVIIGAWGADGFAGESYVVFGADSFAASLDLDTLDGTNGFRLNGIAAGDNSGTSVSGAGDINGDGFDDVIIGAFGANGSAGESYVVFGGPAFAPSLDLASLDGANGFRLNGIDAGDISGISVSGAGDINGDGLADLIIGAQGADGDAGETYVVYGADFTGAITQFGTPGADILTGSPGDDSLVGHLGVDILRGNGGADVLIGGGDPDRIEISDATFRRIDGGGGSDTLVLTGEFDLDLTTISNIAIQSIEVIDLNFGPANTLTLDPEDVFDLSETGFSNLLTEPTANTLLVRGGANDRVNLSNLPGDHPDAAGTWTLASAGTVLVGQLETYDVYMFDPVGRPFPATVYIESDVTVVNPPNLSLTALPGNNAQEVVVQIDSSLFFANDGSETIRLEFGALPEGVTLLGATTSGIIDNAGETEFITLVMEEGLGFDFTLGVKATARETNTVHSASTTQSLNVVLDHEETQQSIMFEAAGLDMWGPGEAFHFELPEGATFIGIDTGPQSGAGGFGPFDLAYAYDVRMGFEQELNIDGGDFSAWVPYNLDFAASYNRTTDMLALDTAAVLAAGGGFMTDGPRADYTLDFVVEAMAEAALDFSLDTNVPGIGVVEGNIFDFGPHEVDWTRNIFSYDSETSPPLEIQIEGDLITVRLQWPEIDVAGSDGTDGLYTGEGASNDALAVEVDVDEIIARIFPVLDFSPSGGLDVDYLASIGVEGHANATLEILDLGIEAGLNFLQNFALQAGSLTGSIVFEDGSTQAFTWGDELVFANASDLDVNGDGEIDLGFEADLLNSQFSNDTDLGFTIQGKLDIATLDYSYRIELPLLDDLGDSGTIGPLVHLDTGDIQLPGSIPIYENTFAVAFDAEQTSLTII